MVCWALLFPLPMEKRTGCVLSLALLLICFCSQFSIQCHGLMSRHLLLESQPPPLSGFKIGLKRTLTSIFLGGFTGLIGAVLVAGMVRGIRQYINRPPLLNGPVVFSPRVDPRTLKLALANENQLLGSSPNGTYLKTTLDNGLVIAVKRLHPFEIGSPESHGAKSVKRKIQRELEYIAGLRHRQLMSLRAYVREPDRFSLVYDYMPTGSLEDAMNRVRKNQLQLNWKMRLRIAVGIIKGLKFLHFDCGTTKVLHYNLKPTNVMLDAEFEPKLGDWGLGKLLPKLDTTSNGYRAPESSQYRYSEKSDIFSFGVILGVLLTGRDPLDRFFGETESGGSLGQWLRHLQQAGEARQALDKSLLGEEEEEDEMVMALRIAVACMSDLPADRPYSDELVPMLSQLHSF